MKALMLVFVFVLFQQNVLAENNKEQSVYLFSNKTISPGADYDYTLSDTFHLKNKTSTQKVELIKKISFNKEYGASLCKDFSLNIFGVSSHPGGNKNGLLNERNGGYGITCYLEKQKNTFISINGLTNSQFGSSLTIGYGKNVNLVELEGVRFDAGITGALVSYERRDSKIMYGALPIPYIRISYDLPKKLGNIAITQHYLGNIKLKSVEMIAIQLHIPL